MANAQPYPVLAQQYVAGVQQLFAPVAATTRSERSAGQVPPDELAARAAQLSASADQLTSAALAAERRNLEQALDTVAAVTPVFYPDATPDALQDALDTPAAIVHFAGHAVFGSQGGYLLLVDDDRRAVRFSAEKLAMSLRGCNVRLAVLSGCQTAERDQANIWSGVAPALTKAGIPAVVGMQYRIADDNAIAFSRRFYRSLAAGNTIDEAVTAGRLAIFTATGEDERDWGVPVLYLRAEEGVLFPRPAAAPVAGGASGNSGVTINGGTVYGPIVGNNQGNITTSYGSQQTGATGRQAARPAGGAVDPLTLRTAMIGAFSVDELKELCLEIEGALQHDGFHEQLNIEVVGGSAKPMIVLNLIQHLQRRGQLQYLLDAVRRARPGLI